MLSSIRVGCAGWSIASAQRALFGDGSSMLERYATRLSVAEVNSSFYRSHRRETWQRWADSVPAGFRFSAKLPRTISHDLALRGAGPALDQFLSEVEGLGNKLGGLLRQLPPSLAFDARSAVGIPARPCSTRCPRERRRSAIHAAALCSSNRSSGFA